MWVFKRNSCPELVEVEVKGTIKSSKDEDVKVVRERTSGMKGKEGGVGFIYVAHTFVRMIFISGIYGVFLWNAAALALKLHMWRSITLVPFSSAWE